MMIHEWVEKHNSHLIYESERKKHEFRSETGLEPVWPEHTEEETKQIMEARGLGGWLEPMGRKRLCFGYEMAESLASEYANFRGTAIGRGIRFREALAALKDAGL